LTLTVTLVTQRNKRLQWSNLFALLNTL